MLEKLALQGKKTLLVLPEHSPNVYLSGRNIPKTKIAIASDINTYDIMNADALILCDGAVDKFQQMFLTDYADEADFKKSSNSRESRSSPRL